MKIILASASPRRRELLQQIGLEFEVQVSVVEEMITKSDPGEVVMELSRQKAEAVLRQARESGEEILVIGADTVVACDGRILGKPADEEDAARMLRLLQGRSHYVYTGVTLCYVPGKARESQLLSETSVQILRQVKTTSFYEAARVDFYPMSEDEISWYASSGEPLDKAGAYGIQGLCARFIRGIEGDYNCVVGLPVGRLYQELKGLEREMNPRTPSGRQKKAVIFDLDGTLSDSLASIKYCADLAVGSFGYGPFTPDQYKYFVGDGAANLVKRCLAAGGDGRLEHFEEAFALYKEIFRENCMYQVKPYDGIPQLLNALKEKGVKIAVLSNKPHEETVNVIETLFGRGYFDWIQGQKEGVAIKPSPEGVFQVLQALKLQADDILYLGDTSTDMKTGKSAGAFTVGALWGFRERQELEENHADAVIEKPMQLLRYL